MRIRYIREDSEGELTCAAFEVELLETGFALTLYDSDAIPAAGMTGITEYEVVEK